MEKFKVLRLNSNESLSSSTASNYDFTFGNASWLNRVTGVKVLGGTFMNQHPNLNSITGNLSLGWSYNSTPQTAITLTAGQYTLTEVMALLQTELRTDSGNAAITVTQGAYTTAYVNKVNINTNTVDTIIIDTGGLGSALGYTADSADATTVTANTIPSLQGLQILNIHSYNGAPLNGFYGSSNLTTNLVNHLFSVPITASYGAMQSFTNDTGYGVEYDDIRDIRNISLTLRDEDGNLLSNWSTQHPFIIHMEVRYFEE